MRLSQRLNPKHVLAEAAAADAAGAIARLVELLVADGAMAGPEPALSRALERERDYATGIGGGVALPHAHVPGLEQCLVALGVFPAGVDFGAADGPARLVFLFLTPPESSSGHLKLLARVTRLARHDLSGRLAERRDPASILHGITEAEQDFPDL